MHRDGPEGRRTPIHYRLGKRVDPQEQLEEEANACIPDEPFARDPEVQEIHHPFPGINQWCHSGLSHSQKRRLQRLHNQEWEERARMERHLKSTVWRAKGKADEVKPMSVNMVFFLPEEFKAPFEEEVE